MMKLLLWAVGGGAAMAVGAAVSASDSTEPPVLVMYEDVGFSGRSVTYDGAVADVDVRYPFLSSKAASGAWELCTRNNFQGACLIVDADVRNIKKEMGFFARVRSLRPVSAAYARREAPAVAGVSVTDPDAGSAAATLAPSLSAKASLAGHDSQFFQDPKLNGEAIDAKDRNSAEEFCSGAGFASVEYRQEIMLAGRKVVGDLLCAGARTLANQQ